MSGNFGRNLAPALLLLGLMLASAGHADQAGLSSLGGEEVFGNTPAAVADTSADSISASVQYSPNNFWEDFEIHFIISLPFTAIYSYLTIFSLDALVQGTFPPMLREPDTWMMMGLALGSSLALALGSWDRVPNQSPAENGNSKSFPTSGPEDKGQAAPLKIDLVRLDF